MAAPIRAFVGANGGGKSLAAMVMCVRPALAAGRPVVATTEINHPNARLLQSWREVPELRSCLLLLDDITSQLPSRQHASVPPQLVRIVNELRHADVELCWTAPNWGRADVAVREVTQSVTVCRGYFPDRALREPVVAPWWRLASKKVGVSDRAWVNNRLFRWVTYDAIGFDDFTYHQVKDIRPMHRAWYYRPWQPEQFLYDTTSFSQLLDHLDDTGACLACGGYRKRQPCTCDRVSVPPSALRAEADTEGSVVMGVDGRDRLGPVIPRGGRHLKARPSV